VSENILCVNCDEIDSAEEGDEGEGFRLNYEYHNIVVIIIIIIIIIS